MSTDRDAIVRVRVLCSCIRRCEDEEAEYSIYYSRHGLAVSSTARAELKMDLDYCSTDMTRRLLILLEFIMWEQANNHEV